jgi:expansin (peptidoglycan-binding protein)
MYTHDFTGRCPSITQIKSHIKKAVAGGHHRIEISWGENWIELERRQYNGFFGPWFGNGWIRRVGGDDLARELSLSERGR